MRPRLEDLVVGLDAKTQQILCYEDDGEEGQETRVVQVQSPLELVKEGHREMTLRNDLQDCHIYVCSPEVRTRRKRRQGGKEGGIIVD